MRVVLALLFALWAVPVQAASYYVNNTGAPACSDATVKASNSAASPWCTIGRAAWGSDVRSTPSAAQAADVGDTVLVTGGTYNNTLNCSPTVGSCRHTVLYNPENAGSAGTYITFTCVGDCIVAAPDWNGPAVGANSKAYIKWYADVRLGYAWTITSYAVLDDAAPAGTVDVTADTGPVVCVSTDHCWIEGFDLNGSTTPDYPSPENYPAIRFEHCNIGCTARNNLIRSFLGLGAHGVGVNLYHSEAVLVEHNDIATVGVCVNIKNAPSSSGTSSFTTRFNKCSTEATGRCWEWSITVTGTEADSQLYQNTCSGAFHGLRSTGSFGVTNAEIFNNVFYNIAGSVYELGLFSSTRVWNNLILTTAVAVSVNGAVFPGAASFDLEHGVYSGATTFYSGSDGNLTRANFDLTYDGSHDDSPATSDSDPRFADAASGDFRLCTGVAAPHVSCAGASPAINIGVDALDLDGDASMVDMIDGGVYVTRTETIGLETSLVIVPRTRVKIRGQEVP